MSLRAIKSAAILLLLSSSVSSCGVTLLLYPLENTHIPRHIDTHTVTYVLKSGYLLLCGGLMRSTVSLRHVHTNILPHILTYRSLYGHTQHEVQQGLRISRLSLARPSIILFIQGCFVCQEYSTECVSCVWLWGSEQDKNKGLIV